MALLAEVIMVATLPIWVAVVGYCRYNDEIVVDDRFLLYSVITALIAFAWTAIPFSIIVAFLWRRVKARFFFPTCALVHAGLACSLWFLDGAQMTDVGIAIFLFGVTGATLYLISELLRRLFGGR